MSFQEKSELLGLQDLQKNTVNHREASVHSRMKKLTVIPFKSLRQNKASKQQPWTPVKPLTPAVNSREGVYTTPRSNRKTTYLADKRRTNPKQVFSPRTTPSGSINRATASSVTPKIGSSRVSGTSSASRNCMTPTVVITCFSSSLASRRNAYLFGNVKVFEKLIILFCPERTIEKEVF